MENYIAGIAASSGIVIGKAYLFDRAEPEIKIELIKDKEEQKNRLTKVLEDYRSVINGSSGLNSLQSELAKTHMELLNDPYLKNTVFEKIESQSVNASYALKKTIDEMVDMMSALEDPYMRERAVDYRDIGQQLLCRLEGIEIKTISSLDENYIIVSEELRPSDTANMDKDRVLGFVMDLGGKTSHVSMIAQTMNIPAIVGTKVSTKEIKHGDELILDAILGRVYINPGQEIKDSYYNKIKELEARDKRLNLLRFKSAVTVDKKEVEISCNIGNLDDLLIGLDYGAQGVGLFRTELLYMESATFPSEEKQFLVYKEVAENLGNKPLLIRTLDIGGDKGLKYFAFPKEENPFLGWRALRLCFDKRDIFREQLRAILRASAFGNIKILLPMVISVEELDKVNAYIEEYKQELREEKIDFNENIEVGVMIETPASVLMADQLIKKCDYFSIGTNDLTQYLLAVDRGNEVVSHLYNNYNPAVLRAVKYVIDASHRAGKWTGMCGSLASDPKAVYLLLGMGLDEFSAVASMLPELKNIIINSSYEEAKIFADEILNMERLEEIEKKIDEKYNEIRRKY